MCTVTFIPAKDKIYLTSNRDEHISRLPAHFPEKYSDKNSDLIYPRDNDAGGSWIAMKTSGDAAVLLNGAFAKHVRATPYRKSRGLIFIEIIKAGHPEIVFNEMELEEIEPFTMVVYLTQKLYEFRWDGNEKYILNLDPAMPHIWSSVTLYNEPARTKRKNWFKHWQQSTKIVNTETILDFHRFAGSEDPENGLVINRDGQMQTVSITSISFSGSSASMVYVDLKNERKFSETLSIELKQDPAPLFNTTSLKARKFFIKLFNREYWPHNIVYAPVYFYWFWLGLRARSFFFFNASNPLIKNGGFLMESKKQIYDLMPPTFYPKTILCHPAFSASDLKFLVKKHGLSFPLIAKPDVGLQGLCVELVQNTDDLIAYIKKNKVDFLLQEFVNYEQEVGIFYYRIPGASKGNISGIVGKEFITVTGDGKSTIEQLLSKKGRYLLQLKVLKASYGKSLQTVLPEGLKKMLAPYGNHRRGSKFTDLSHKVNEKLVNRIDAICRLIPEFYYGRLDIKFNDWEEMCEGKNFSIIELNGAGSEPTHIYDPKHSLFFVWKEIIRHWDLLFTISRLNATQKKINFMSTREGLKMLKENAEHLKLISQ